VLEDLFDALGSRDQHQEVDVLGALLAEQLNRCGRRTARCEHGVHDEHVALSDVLGELAVVLDRLQGLRVAVQTHVTDAGGGDELQDAVDHPEPCAQDRNDGDLLAGEHIGRGLGYRGQHGGLGELKAARRLVGLEHREFLHELAELLGAGLLVAHDRQLVLNQRVVHHGDVGIRALLGHACGSSRSGRIAVVRAGLELGVERVLLE